MSSKSGWENFSLRGELCTQSPLHCSPTINSIPFFEDNEENIVQEIPKETIETKKTSNATYHGVDGNPISKDILADITQFQVNKCT